MINREEGIKLREIVQKATEKELENLDLPNGVIKVIRFFILFRSMIKSGTLTIDDIMYPKKYDGEAFAESSLNFIDYALPEWLNGEIRFAMLDFLEMEIKTGKFHKTEYYRILHAMAEKIFDIYPTGWLDGQQSAELEHLLVAVLQKHAPQSTCKC